MALQHDLSRMDVQAMMSVLGYAKSLLPRNDVDIYVKGQQRILIDITENWVVPSSDFVRTLTQHEVSWADIERAYRTVYPDLD